MTNAMQEFSAWRWMIDILIPPPMMSTALSAEDLPGWAMRNAVYRSR
jgi:hypothetical protein